MPRCASRALLTVALLLAVVAPPPAQAARVIALAPHLAELACAAGGCDQLVGRVEHSDYPESVRALPSVGDAFAINAERLLALRPSLVLSWTGGTAPATVAQLRRLGMRVVEIDIRKLADIEAALRQLGRELGQEATAEAEAQRFHDRLAQLAAQYRDRKRLRVFFQIEAEPMFTVNRDSPISEAITLCGGDNVFADLPQLSGTLGREAVLARDPDVVVWGRQDHSEGIEAFWRRWPSMRATRGGHLYAIDADTLSRATPRMANGIAELCAAMDRARQRPPF